MHCSWRRLSWGIFFLENRTKLAFNPTKVPCFLAYLQNWPASGWKLGQSNLLSLDITHPAEILSTPHLCRLSQKFHRIWSRHLPNSLVIKFSEAESRRWRRRRESSRCVRERCPRTSSRRPATSGGWCRSLWTTARPHFPLRSRRWRDRTAAPTMCCGASDAATASELKADPKLHRRLDWAAYGRWRSWKIIKITIG